MLSTQYAVPRIVPTAQGYEVWSGTYHVTTCVSRLAALEELRYLESLMLRTED
jgi:hypothetical protein